MNAAIQSNIVQFQSKQPTWLQQAKRLHDDGHKDFNLICAIARTSAQSVAFPRDNTLSAMIENMTFIESDPESLNYTVSEMGKVYNGTYFSHSSGDDCHMAEVLPFPAVQGGV